LNWRDVLPSDVASKQEAWERDCQVVRLYAAHGATLKSVGALLGIKAERVRQRIARALRRSSRSPVDIYLVRGLAFSPVDALILLKGMQNLRFTTEEEWNVETARNYRLQKEAAARERSKAREAERRAQRQRELQEQEDKHYAEMNQRRAAKQAWREEIERVNAAHNRQPTALARDALKGKHLNGKAE
jgi:hypothetical protein